MITIRISICIFLAWTIANDKINTIVKDFDDDLWASISSGVSVMTNSVKTLSFYQLLIVQL